MQSSKSGSKKTQPLKWAIFGTPGSFTEEAAELYLHHQSSKVKFIYQDTVGAVFQIVKDKEADIGIVPFENSNSGLVEDTSEALVKYQIKLVDTIDLNVSHNLLVMPGTKRSEVTEIVSHEQGLAQCKNYLSQNWPDTKTMPYKNTALAAKDLAEGKLPPTIAVIASARAAKLFGLEILEHNVQDADYNFTGFIIFKD